MIRARCFRLLSISTLALALGAGCAPVDGTQDEEAASTDDALRQQLQDEQLMDRLREILRDVTFVSEGDFGYVVFEGEAVSEGTRLSTRIVREKLAAAVKANSSEQRDIALASCRAARLNVGRTIAEGNAAEVPEDPESDDWVYAHHDKQLGAALKTMRAQLRSVVGLTFGTNEWGDQDDQGPVLYVWVGVSKTSGKLIAIMTEAVYT